MEEKKFSAVKCPQCKAEMPADKTVANWYCGYCGTKFPLNEEKAVKPAVKALKVTVKAKGKNVLRDAQSAVKKEETKPILTPPLKKEEVKEEPKASQPAPAPKKEEPKAVQPAPAPKKEEPKAAQPAPAPKKEEPKAAQPAPATKKEEPKAVQPAPAPKKEEPKASQPATAPKKEEPKAAQPAPTLKKEDPKAAQPAPAPKKEEPKATQPAPVPQKKSSPEDFMIIHGMLEKYKGSAEEVEIPEDVEVISSGAFKGNTTIKSVIIPDAVYDIGDSAFDGCTALENVKLPLQITKVGYKTFNGCDSLKSITIPRGVKEIVYNALTCGLREITVESSRTTWEPENEYAMPSFEVDKKGTGEGVRTIYFRGVAYSASELYRHKSVAAFLRTQGLCVHCGGRFGLFSKCKNCGSRKDY